MTFADRVISVLTRLLIFIPIASCCATAHDKTLTLWDANYLHPPTLAFLELALEKAQPEFGRFQLQRSVQMDLAAAYKQLQQGDELDIIVSGNRSDWETTLSTVYFPLNRGLLGFRVCLIQNSELENLSAEYIGTDFTLEDLKIGVAMDWPDRNILENADINVWIGQSYDDLIAGLSANLFNCFSRSVIEIDREIVKNPILSEWPALAILYPMADIIYVSKDAESLANILLFGLERAHADGSYQRLFESYYGDLLKKHDFYSRKLLVLNDNTVSQPALSAINRYGVASFVEHQAN